MCEGEADNKTTLNDIKDSIDNYVATCQAIQAFINIIIWDRNKKQYIQSSKYNIGRRMDTSKNNKITPENTITPDIIIQRSKDYGFVVEVKKTLPKNQSYWAQYIDQLLKYDDHLLGWWTGNEKINEHNTVLLVHQYLFAKVEKYIKEKFKEMDIDLLQPFSIVEFSRSPERKFYIFIRCSNIYPINNIEISEEIINGIPVPFETVLLYFGNLRFYDVKPETEYVMSILWLDIFNEKRINVDYDKSKKYYPIKVDANELTIQLQKLYGSLGNNHRKGEFPKKKWIREALDALVIINYAEYLDNGIYIIKYRKLTQDPIEIFYSHRESIRIEQEETKQLNLFNS